MVKIWKARESNIKLASASDVDFSATDKTLEEIIDAASGGTTILTARAKNVTVVEPEGDVDKIDLLGEDTNGFQNAELEEKPYGLAQITGTLVFSDAESLEAFAGNADTVTVSDGDYSGTYKRYRIGDGNRQDVVAVITLKSVSNSSITDYVAFALDNAKITRIGDIRISGADGHWEQDFKIVCLPRDFYGPEFKTA